MIRLTKSEVLNFPPDTYTCPLKVIHAVQATYACGIDVEVAKRIIRDYNAKS